MDLLFDEIEKNLVKIGIPINKYNYKISNQTKKFGSCQKIGDIYEIKISKYITDQNVLKRTIAHELIHTCDNCRLHEGKWFEYASLADIHYDYGITKTGIA